MAVSLSYIIYCRCSVSQGHRRYFTCRDGATSPLVKPGNYSAPLDPEATTTSLWYASTPKCSPFNYASFLVVVPVIVLVRVSYFPYFPYRSAILTAIPILVGLLSLRLSTPPPPFFSISTLYHSFPVYAVSVPTALSHTGLVSQERLGIQNPSLYLDPYRRIDGTTILSMECFLLDAIWSPVSSTCFGFYPGTVHSTSLSLLDNFCEEGMPKTLGTVRLTAKRPSYFRRPVSLAALRARFFFYKRCQCGHST